MDVMGLSKYVGPHAIEAGKLYVANSGKDLFLVLAIDPFISGDPPGVVILKSITNLGIADFRAHAAVKFANASRFREIESCKLGIVDAATSWRLSPHDYPEKGSLFSTEKALYLVVENSEGQKFLVDAQTGTINQSSMGYTFWTSDWTILKQDVNGRWAIIFRHELGPSSTS